MKRIAKKLCSTVCALLAFSGNRGGALTKEILCNVGQWLACCLGFIECYGCYNLLRVECEQGKLVPKPNATFGQKAFVYEIGAATIANAVDAAKRSCDNIACDIIKGSKNKPDTTNKKESKNYWPILEAIFGVSNFALAFGHRPILDTKCEGVCSTMITPTILSVTLLTDAYFRFRGSNQTSHSSNSK